MIRTDVVVAVLTYRRPDDLREALIQLTAHLAAARTPATLLVVDNDVEPSAQSAVAQFPGIAYAHEPRPGIAAARNRALDEADGADVLVFIDDDERPQPGWLDALVETWQRERPAAVAGPVVSTFAAPVEAWIAAGGFFDRPRYPTGTEVVAAATNNLLLGLQAVRTRDLRFDDRFGLSGGSDTLFTRMLVRNGGRIVWCDEALVLDVVPVERLSRRWVLQRYRRMGNSSSRAEVLTAAPGFERLVARCRLVGGGAGRVVVGAARRGIGAVSKNPIHHARGSRTMVRGIGMLTGAIGTVVAEYARSSPGLGPTREAV